MNGAGIEGVTEFRVSLFDTMAIEYYDRHGNGLRRLISVTWKLIPHHGHSSLANQAVV